MGKKKRKRVTSLKPGYLHLQELHASNNCWLIPVGGAPLCLLVARHGYGTECPLSDFFRGISSQQTHIT
jgi:hypothetical protein